MFSKTYPEWHLTIRMCFHTIFTTAGGAERLRWMLASCPLEPEVDNPTVGKRSAYPEWVGFRFPHIRVYAGFFMGKSDFARAAKTEREFCPMKKVVCLVLMLVLAILPMALAEEATVAPEATEEVVVEEVT